MFKSHPCVSLFVAFLVLCLSGCLSRLQHPSVTLETVGTTSMTQQDVDFQEQILRFSYPQYQGDLKQAARQQLLEHFRLAEILKNNHHAITQEVLKKESDRIDQSTLMPEALSKIKALFKGDIKSYLKVYVLPVYAGRVIYYEFFLHDKKIQANSLASAESFLSAARQSPSIYLDKKIKKTRLTISRARGIEWAAHSFNPKLSPTQSPVEATQQAIEDKLKQDQKNQESAEGKRWIQDVISKLKPGETYPQVIEQQTDWWVIRLLRKKEKLDDTYEIEAVFFPKEDYSKWLEAEKKKIQIIR